MRVLGRQKGAEQTRGFGLQNNCEKEGHLDRLFDVL
jgi:hypothetical protein